MSHPTHLSSRFLAGGDHANPPPPSNVSREFAQFGQRVLVAAAEA
jgi:hypothetical protein